MFRDRRSRPERSHVSPTRKNPLLRAVDSDRPGGSDPHDFKIRVQSGSASYPYGVAARVGDGRRGEPLDEKSGDLVPRVEDRRRARGGVERLPLGQKPAL